MHRLFNGESDGTPEYSITEIDKTDRGAEIILHIAEDSLEFLEEARISELLNKYCKFLPVEIIFGENTEMVDDANGEKDDEGNVKKVEVKSPRVIIIPDHYGLNHLLS